MERSYLFEYINDRLGSLAFKIEQSGKLNILNLNIHAEHFYQRLLNLSLDLNFENANTYKNNTEAIDLIDKQNKVIAQVSATATKQKLDATLQKDLSNYTGYEFKFISIAKDASHLKKATFTTNHVKFNPSKDIYDYSSILKIINSMDISRLQKVYTLIKEELGTKQERIPSNIAKMINILSKEDWEQDSTYQTNSFNIEEKITFNQLDAAKVIIEDYKIHHARVAQVYATFDKQGKNKSKSVLDFIRRCYAINSVKRAPDELFFKIVDAVINRTQESNDTEGMPLEELELCANIIVVDAFIRCKIFKNPVGG